MQLSYQNLKSPITSTNGSLFTPIYDLVRKELSLRGHSTEYIHKYVNENPLKFRVVSTEITEKVIVVLFNRDIALSIDLKDISRAPYWIVQQLLEWGFELELPQSQVQQDLQQMYNLGTFMYCDHKQSTLLNQIKQRNKLK